MITFPDETVPKPPLPIDNIHHDKENEKYVQTMKTKPTTTIFNLKLAQKKSPSQLKKSIKFTLIIISHKNIEVDFAILKCTGVIFYQ